jgi:hypothetical protein
MKVSWVVVLAAVLADLPAVVGQGPVHGKAAATPAGLSVEDVIKLSKAGLSEDIIVQQVKKRSQPFDLTTDQLIALKTANVSDRIVAFMLDPSKPATAAPAAAGLGGPVAPLSATAEPEPALPGEIGVYARKQNQWVEVAPEIVYWKTGGALKTIATAGVLHGDVNGRVLGVSSHTSFAAPLELLIVAPEGVVVAEYQLIRLRSNKDSREFRTVTGGIFHSQSGAFRDMLNFDSKKLASRAYEVTFPSSAGPGEYGLLPPGANNGSGKIYSFRIAESAPMVGPAAPVPALHPAPTAVLPATAVPVIAAQWTPHNDPMGFSVNLPASWQARGDREAGRIAIQGPQGQRAIIWPMFLERQALDQRSASVLVRQLAHRAGPELSWGTPETVGGAARVLAHGPVSGAAIIRWNAVSDGTQVSLFCVTAPAPLYAASVDVFSRILQSFHVTPAASEATVPPVHAYMPLKWTRWTDPREGAFGASIPQGWSITGGSIRHSATDIRKSVVVVSPDREIRITLGDTSIGAYTAPTALYGSAGLREGMYNTLGDGSKLQIRRFVPAPQFVREYISGPALRDCTGLNILSENQRPDLAAETERQAREHRVPNVRITTSGIAFSCSWNGRPARGYYAAVTAFVPAQMGGLWYVDPMYGYLAVSERQQDAETISRHIYESMQVNSDWKRKENQMAAEAVQADNARSAEIQARARQAIAEDQRASDMIVKGYEARSKVYDEISRKRENAILGTVDVVDPNTGKQYKIDNYSDYHWMNNQGVIAGTKTDTSPGVDWRQLITLP